MKVLPTSHLGSIKALSDQQLMEEWAYWDHLIAVASSWGGALTAADEFRADCRRELRRRKLPLPEYDL